MRPNTKVSTTKKTITPMFNASTAGRNCIFANHPSQVCSVPVKSRNSPVMSTNTTRAQVNLIFRNIIVNLENSKRYQDLVCSLRSLPILRRQVIIISFDCVSRILSGAINEIFE